MSRCKYFDGRGPAEMSYWCTLDSRKGIEISSKTVREVCNFPEKCFRYMKAENARLLCRISEQDQQIGRLEGTIEGLQADLTVAQKTATVYRNRYNLLNAEATTIRDVLEQWQTFALLKPRDENFIRCNLALTKKALAITGAGARVLDIVEAARQIHCVASECVDCEQTGDCQLKPIIAALSDLDKGSAEKAPTDCATCTKERERNG